MFVTPFPEQVVLGCVFKSALIGLGVEVGGGSGVQSCDWSSR